MIFCLKKFEKFPPNPNLLLPEVKFMGAMLPSSQESGVMSS